MAMNPWEVAAMQAAEGGQSGSEVATRDQSGTQQDPLIYPGLYAPSGFDMIDILFRVTARPNAQVDIGAVDASCALILCDLLAPDHPIVYASEPFLALTGYAMEEVLGRNCRFLQAPGWEAVTQGQKRRHVPSLLVKKMRKAVEENAEVQLEVPNFCKDGTAFTNILTMIPITWDDENVFRYSVGFQCDKWSA